MITVQTPPSGTFGAFKPQGLKKKSYITYVVAIFAILILAAGYYLFFNQGISISLESPTFPPAPALTALDAKIINLPNFSFGAIDSDFYKSLKVYGSVPVVADSLGRVNPFIPY